MEVEVKKLNVAAGENKDENTISLWKGGKTANQTITKGDLSKGW